MTTCLTDIKAILLDMDGTLFDTELLYKASWQTTASWFGFELGDEAYMSFVGTPLAVCIDRIKHFLPGTVTLRSFLQQLQKTQSHLEQTQGIQMKPGADKLLAFLQQGPLPVGLVTSSQRKYYSEHFENTAYNALFHTVITFEDVTQHKPHPEPYIKACNYMGLPAENTLVIEDSNTGATSALDAGCKTLIVPDTMAPSGEVAGRAWGVYDNLHQIVDTLLIPYYKKTFSG